MDLSALVKTDGGNSSEIFFAKREILASERAAAAREKKKQAKASSAAGKDAAAADTAASAAAAAAPAGKKTKGGAGAADGKRRKKHLSHKKDPIPRDEQRRTVFVGNLPNTVSHQQVAKFFEGLVGTPAAPAADAKGSAKPAEAESVVEAARLRCVRLAQLQEGQKDRGRGVRILRGEIDESEQATATAYVVFRTVAAADAAVGKTGTVFKGHHLSISGESPEAKAFMPRSSVYMGNMPYSVTDEAVWAFFIDNGIPDITRVRVVRDQQTGKAKGFGYVEFASREAVVKALKLKQPELQGRAVRIFSVQKSRDPTIQHVTRRDKRAVTANAAASPDGAAAVPAGKKKSKKDGKQDASSQGQAHVARAPKVKSVNAEAAEERPSWMGATADPRKKLSKELRWLTQDSKSRTAAAKSRHKDRVRANFVKNKKQRSDKPQGSASF